MSAYRTKAVCLKNIPFGEADKLVTLFSQRKGKIKAIAKGARRIPSRFGGRVETFTYGDYFIVAGRNLDLISECEVIETFQKIRENPKTLQTALYFLRLVDSAAMEEEANLPLFNLFLKFLVRLKNQENLEGIIKDFEEKFAKIEGIYREKVPSDISISRHLEEDIRKWKK